MLIESLPWAKCCDISMSNIGNGLCSQEDCMKVGRDKHTENKEFKKKTKQINVKVSKKVVVAMEKY